MLYIWTEYSTHKSTQFQKNPRVLFSGKREQLWPDFLHNCPFILNTHRHVKKINSDRLVHTLLTENTENMKGKIQSTYIWDLVHQKLISISCPMYRCWQYSDTLSKNVELKNHCVLYYMAPWRTIKSASKTQITKTGYHKKVLYNLNQTLFVC